MFWHAPAGQLHASLLPAQSLLSEVARMGPLMSLIKANVVRDEFLRINRDITSTFSLLAAGEQLLVSCRSWAKAVSHVAAMCSHILATAVMRELQLLSVPQALHAVLH